MDVFAVHCVMGLLEEVSRLASEGRFDYLIIESTGV